MTNPTINSNQFDAPYNILPDVLYTNPTVASSQFTMPLTLGQSTTYNILPDSAYTNPTNNAGAQFTMPITLGQLATYNILPDATFVNTTVAAAAQFSTPLTLGQVNTFNYVSTNDVIANPTNGISQFNPNTQLGNQNTFNYTTDNDVISNPTNDTAQFKPTTTLGNQNTFNYTTDNDNSLLAYNNVNNTNTQGLAQLSQSTANPTLANNTWGFGAAQPGAPSLFSNIWLSQFTPDRNNLNSNTFIVDPAIGINTNISPKSVGRDILSFAVSSLGSISGIPQVAQVGQTALGAKNLEETYLTLAKDRLTRQGISRIIKYPDFRSRFTFPEKDLFNETNATFQTSNQTIAYFTNRRVDGLAASLRTGIKKSWKAITYAAAAATPVGPYSVFNLDGFGNTGYGYGDHDNPDAFRNDFTVRSHVATNWKPEIKSIAAVSKTGAVFNFSSNAKVPYGNWQPTNALQELVVPFRGDKVSVIDFGKRTLKDAYLWKPKRKLDFFDKQSLTQDFIKFYLTGPKLHNGTRNNTFLTPNNNADDAEDDIIVFRAHITSLDDSFTANWSGVNYIGRADPSYIYTGMSRDVGLSFDVYATDRDEVKPIWRKLNALAGYTAPTYDAESISMIAPWMRMTVGDLFVQAPVTLTSVQYQFGMDAPWEINIEEDPAMMQVPLKISVQLSFNMVGDHLPQKHGRFYTLAKRFDDTGIPIAGDDNWLSDSRDNYHVLAEQEEQKKIRKTKRAKITEKVADNGSSTNTTKDITGLVTNNAGGNTDLGIG